MGSCSACRFVLFTRSVLVVRSGGLSRERASTKALNRAWLGSAGRKSPHRVGRAGEVRLGGRRFNRHRLQHYYCIGDVLTDLESFHILLGSRTVCPVGIDPLVHFLSYIGFLCHYGCPSLSDLGEVSRKPSLIRSIGLVPIWLFAAIPV